MFAEDVQILKGKVFTTALKSRWIWSHNKFKSEIESLWKTMKTGGNCGFDAILKDNGSLFADGKFLIYGKHN
jgi:hypothetical protein